jgi:hypothetical protein
VALRTTWRACCVVAGVSSDAGTPGVDGEFVVEALGLPAPLFRDLRPPETFPAHAAMGSTLHRWRMSVASSITGVGNPLNLDDE